MCVWQRCWLSISVVQRASQPTNSVFALAHLPRGHSYLAHRAPCPLSSRVPSSISLWCRRPGYLSLLRTHLHPTSPVAACGRVQPGCEGSRCVGAVAGSLREVALGVVCQARARPPKNRLRLHPHPPLRRTATGFSSHLLALAKLSRPRHPVSRRSVTGQSQSPSLAAGTCIGPSQLPIPPPSLLLQAQQQRKNHLTICIESHLSQSRLSRQLLPPFASIACLALPYLASQVLSSLRIRLQDLGTYPQRASRKR